jgi:hypothetical protein
MGPPRRKTPASTDTDRLFVAGRVPQGNEAPILQKCEVDPFPNGEGGVDNERRLEMPRQQPSGPDTRKRMPDKRSKRDDNPRSDKSDRPERDEPMQSDRDMDDPRPERGERGDRDDEP